jgi:hypothetical protein
MFIRSLLIAAVAALTFNMPSLAQTGPDPDPDLIPPTLSLTVIPRPGEVLDPAGANTFTAQAGVVNGFVRWSIIFSYALNDCVGLTPSCTVELLVNGSSGAGDVLGTIDVLTALSGASSADGVEWNMLSQPLFSEIDNFDPLLVGSLDFTLSINGWTDPAIPDPVTATVDIEAANGNNIPEPGTLALIGIAMVSAGYARRRFGLGSGPAICPPDV